MQIVGEKVRHKTLGSGVVTEQTEDRIVVRFPSKEIRMEYPESFGVFLTAGDPDLQGAILEEIRRKKEREAALRAEEEARRKEEAERKAEEDGKADEEARRELGKRSRLPSKKRVVQKRLPGQRLTFFVFQGDVFGCQSRNGFIWAPVYNKAGENVHHWERLEFVRPGDILFHGCNGLIRAISTAQSGCYACPEPEEMRSEGAWEQEGRRVDCDYILLEKPIETDLVRDEILRLCAGVKYAPFDRDGNGNTGYLYELNRDLARVFLKEIIKKNPLIGDLGFVRELLAEKDEP